MCPRDVLEKGIFGDQHRLRHDALLDTRNLKIGPVPDGRKDLPFSLICRPLEDGAEIGQNLVLEVVLLVHESH